MSLEPEHAGEVRVLQLVVAGIVEVTEPPVVRVQSLDRDRRLHMLRAVGRTQCVGQVKSIHLDDGGPAQHELFSHLRREGAPYVQLEHGDPVEHVEIGGRKLEKRPLIAFESYREREWHCRERIGAGGMQQLYPEVNVAVGFWPRAVHAVKRMPHISIGVEIPKAKVHSPSASRTNGIHFVRQKPCCRNSIWKWSSSASMRFTLACEVRPASKRSLW